MSIKRDDNEDIRELVEHGSSAWIGPSPSASQSRWAARAARHPVARAARLVAVVAGFTFIVFALALAAASRSPRGAAATVMHLVSHPFPGRLAVPPEDSPSVSVSVSPSPAPSATGPAAPAAAARPAARPTPSPVRRSEQEDRRPSPSPSGSARPYPSPSTSTDE